jgi:hypothetical protein
MEEATWSSETLVSPFRSRKRDASLSDNDVDHDVVIRKLLDSVPKGIHTPVGYLNILA